MQQYLHHGFAQNEEHSDLFLGINSVPFSVMKGCVAFDSNKNHCKCRRPVIMAGCLVQAIKGVAVAVRQYGVQVF